jgi:hypothetical protein
MDTNKNNKADEPITSLPIIMIVILGIALIFIILKMAGIV